MGKLIVWSEGSLTRIVCAYSIILTMLFEFKFRQLYQFACVWEGYVKP